MDVMSDADQFQDDEDEDWTETGWADPGELTVLPSKHTKQKPKPAAARKMNIEIGEKKSDVVSGMALNDNKAGMAGLDREKINKIIMEASAGSKFYENEKKKEEQVKKRIDEQRKKLEKITEKQISDGEVEADQLLQQLDSTRDLSRTIVHVDMDAFYAAAEMRDNPSLRDKPMAVGGNSMLSTSNYAARRYGVRAAMPGFIGKKLCPELVIVPLNFEKYTAISKQVRSVMADYDPNYCPMSLDEAYLDLTEHLKKRQTYTAAQRTFEIMDFVRQKINNKLPSAGENVGEDKGNEGKSREDSLASADVSQYAEHVKKQRSVVNKECDGLEDMYSDEELDCLIRNIPNNIVDTGTNICEKTRALLPEADCCLSKSKAVDHEERGRVVFGLSADEAVREMRFRIEQTTGLTASAGIAPNMMLAKVCSDKNKPNGQYRIPPTREAVLEFIENLPIRKVMGIGKVSESMLKALDVTMCEHLYEKRAILYHLYSAISFNYFMRICIGIGSTKVERDGERKSMSVERTFNEINKPAELYKKCLELSEVLAEDLKEENLKGRTVTIKMKTVAFEVKTRAQSLMEYTSDPEVIFSTAKEQLRLEIQASQPKPLRLRLLGVRMSNFQDSETSKKKQTTIKDMFPRAQEVKSAKTSDIVCVPIKADAAEKMDENGNIVEAKSGIDVTSQVGRVADSLGGKTSAVRMAGDSIGQKCSDDGTHCGQPFAADNRVFDDGVDQTSLDIIKLKVPIHVSGDVDNDPVYLQDTDVDSDAECKTKSSDMFGDLSEHTLRKPAGIVVIESENSCHKVCEDSERFVNQSGAKCEFSDLAPMKKESLDRSVRCDTCTKNSVTVTYQVACDSSGPSDLNNNGPFDVTRPNIGASTYGDAVLNSMIGRRGSRKVVVDTDLSEDADVSSSDTEVPKHCNEALTGPTKQTVTRVWDSSCTVDEELVSRPSGQTGANDSRKVTSGAKKQAFPCPVCNENIFCKDMIEFNRHLDNCLCGNSQPVSQNLRSQNSGVVKNKGKSLARQRKLKKGKVANALGGKPSPSLNETLDRFMFKQEKSFSVHNFNEEESRDACDFLSYEESFAEEPTEFSGDILSDEDAPCESLKPVLCGGSDADTGYTVTSSNLGSTGVIPSRRLFATDNVDLSKTELFDFPKDFTACKSSDISDCAIQLRLVTESESLLTGEPSDREQLVCKAPSSSGSQQITSATDEAATMIESHINESDQESQPNNEASAKVELVPAVDSSASTLPKSGVPRNNLASTTGSQPTDGASAALESSAFVGTSAGVEMLTAIETSAVVETSAAVELEVSAAVDMSAAVKTTEPSAITETAPLVEKSSVVKMSTAVETSAKSNPTTKPSGLLCPICNKTLRTKNLEKFNRHLDACLSGQSKREPKPRKRKASFGGRTSKRCKNDYSFEEWEEWE